MLQKKNHLLILLFIFILNGCSSMAHYGKSRAFTPQKPKNLKHFYVENSTGWISPRDNNLRVTYKLTAKTQTDIETVKNDHFCEKLQESTLTAIDSTTDDGWNITFIYNLYSSPEHFIKTCSVSHLSDKPYR